MPESYHTAADAALHQRLKLLAHVGFLLIGAVNTLLGTALPLLAARWQLKDSEAGFLFLLQFAGAIAGSLLSGRVMQTFGMTRTLATGYLLLSGSMVGLALSQWAGATISVTALGLGLGFVNPSTNLLIAELAQARRAAALNIVNLIWGLGALLSPPLVALLSGNNFSRMLCALSVLLLLVSVSVFFRPSLTTTARAQMSSAASFRLWQNSYAILTGVLIFVYVGTEAAVGGWIALFAQRMASAQQSELPLSASSQWSPGWALMASFFWGGLLVGRSLAPFALRFVTETKLILYSLIAASMGLMVLQFSHTATDISAGTFLTGLGLASVFPTTFALFTQRAGAQAAQMVGGLFLMSSLGSATIPWLTGLISSYFGSLRVGLLVPLLGSLLLIALQIRAMRVITPQASA
jgi:fucose permease